MQVLIIEDQGMVDQINTGCMVLVIFDEPGQ